MHCASGAGLAALRALESAGPVAAHLQSIYRASTAAEAEQRLRQLESKWKAYPRVSHVWRRKWGRITPFFPLPARHPQSDLHHQRVESLNRSLRKITQNSRRVPQQRSGAEIAVSCSSGNGEEIDHANPPLAGNPEALYDSGQNGCRLWRELHNELPSVCARRLSEFPDDHLRTLNYRAPSSQFFFNWLGLADAGWQIANEQLSTDFTNKAG